MKTQMNRPKVTATLFVLALLTLITAGLAHAEDKIPEGFFLGVNAGYGGSSYGYTEGSKSIWEEGADGAVGGLRAGYAVSSKFALSIEGYGFGDTSEGEDEELGIGAGLIAVTWHPVGKGFFLRAGFGGGGGNMLHPESGEKITIRDRAAGLFGLGYDWRIGSKTSLGLSVDSIIINAGGALGNEDDYVTGGGLTLQFTWHL